MLLGSPLGTSSLELVLDSQISNLQLIGERLHHIHTHNALTLLHHSFFVPKLLHVLRTSPAFQAAPLLIIWDQLALLLSIVSKITNINSIQMIPVGFRPPSLCGLVVSASEEPLILHLLPVWPQLMEPTH